MLPQIDNKPLLDCCESEFNKILNNPDYRENQYLDYKLTFSFLECSRNEKPVKISEFRKDVCAFANADGGYLVYGIAENEGLATKIIGVDIDNPDKFELELRNSLMPIMPKVPPFYIRFAQLGSEKYIVVMFIEHDYYAPYLYTEDEKNYKIYKRDGNRSVIMRYTELKNMFAQSHVLETEILKFRRQQVEYYKEQGIERFLIYHIIPELFLNDRKQLFLIEKQKHISFEAVFSQAGINTKSIPCVDGLRFSNTHGDEKAIIYNNGIVEYMLPFDAYIQPLKGRLVLNYEDVWDRIDFVSQGYQSIMPGFFGNQRYFGCVSIIGCKSIISEGNELMGFETVIDRDQIICTPTVFTNIENIDDFYNDLKRLHLEYLLSLGIKRSSSAAELINEFTACVD